MISLELGLKRLVPSPCTGAEAAACDVVRPVTGINSSSINPSPPTSHIDLYPYRRRMDVSEALSPQWPSSRSLGASAILPRPGRTPPRAFGVDSIR
jgi:hypothetical protein